MRLLIAAFLLLLPCSSVAFTRPTNVNLVKPFKTKPLNGWIKDRFSDVAEDLEEQKDALFERLRKPTINDVIKGGVRLIEAGKEVTWEVKDDGIFGFVPTKEMTGVEPHITRLCATISKQLYNLKSKDQFKVSTKDNKGELVIFNNHKPIALATPPFAAVVSGDTMILGWRGTDPEGVFDLLNDVACSPQSNIAWRQHAKNVKVQGAMTSIVLNDIALHENEIIAEIKARGAKGTPIKEIVCTGQSLGGGCCQIGHLVIRAQMGEEHSPWHELNGINVRSVGFCAPMTIVLLDDAPSHTDDFVEALDENSCNMVFSNDIIPRTYGYLSFVEDFINNSLNDVTDKIPVPKLAKVIFDVKGKLEDGIEGALDASTVKNIVEVISQYRHLGKLVYYETEDSKPRVLQDMGAFYQNSKKKRDIFRDIKYKRVGSPADEFMNWHMSIIGEGEVYGPNADNKKTGLAYPVKDLF